MNQQTDQYPEEYPFINRTAIVVVPQQPFLDWLNERYPSDLQTLESLQKDSNIFLIPEFDFLAIQSELDKKMERYLRKNCRSIFFHQLFEWYEDEETFPALTYKNFLKFFRISCHTMIYDMVDKSIEKE